MSARTQNPPLTPEDENEGMRGDAVGTTLYSERWILKILMQLTKLTSEEWTSDLENELCMLWDMSAEEDVVHLLMQHDMLGLATHVILNHDNKRLTEIMVGIIGNMCCVKNVRNVLGCRADVVDVLLELLSYPDVLTLLQVLRVFQAVAWDVKNRYEMEGSSHDCCEKTKSEEHRAGLTSKKDDADVNSVSDDASMKEESCRKVEFPQKFSEPFLGEMLHSSAHPKTSAEVKDPTFDDLWLQYFMKIDSWLPKILFILSSSKHDELLSSTWAFLSTMCYIPIDDTVLSQHIVDANLMLGMLESYKECFEERFKNDEIESVKKAAGLWISVLYSFTLHREGVIVLCQFKTEVLKCIFRMLHYCHSAIVLDEELATFVLSSLTVLDVIFSTDTKEWSHFTSGLLSLIKLWEKLSECRCMKSKENGSAQLEEDTIKALEEFFGSVYKCLNEKKNDESFEKLHYIHKQLSQLLNSKVT